MTNTPPPLNRANLTRAGIAGFGLAILGIISFIILWLILGSFQVASLPRLFVSLCVPPAGIAGIIGIYMLVRKPNR